MMLKSREYLRDAGTGLLLSLLVFATLLVAIPAPIQPALAAQAPPTITISPTVFKPGSASITVEFTNPSGNTQPLVAEVVTFPSGWTGVSVTSPTTGCSVLGATVSCSVSVPPTATLSIAISATAPSQASYPVTQQVQTSFQYSGEGFRTGPSLTVYIVDPTTSLSVSASPTSIGAGSSSTITATLSPAQAGIPILFSITSGPGSLSASSAMTDSSGKASVTYTSTVTGPASISATAGGNPGITGGPTSVTVTPGSPAKVSVAFTSGFATHYLTTSGTDAAGAPGATMPNTDVKYGVTDSFGNPIDFSSLSGLSVTLTALTGSGRFNKGATTAASISCPTDFACPTSGTTASLPSTNPYFQGPDFNTVGTISVTISGSSPAFGPIAATTGNIITSTFATSSPPPTITGAITSAPGCAPASPPCQQAGKTVTVSATISPVQKNVPVTLYVCTKSTTPPFTCATTAGYAGTFSNGQQKITLMTDSTGTVSDNFAVDTHAGSAVQFVAEVAAPIDSNPAKTLGNSSTPSSLVTTIAGPPSKIVVSAFFKNTCTPPSCAPGTWANPVGSVAAAGTQVWVDVSITDAYGNLATNPGPAQIQITLSATGGALSATTIYIAAGQSRTWTSFGPVSWVLPTSLASYTLTASAVLAGSPVSASKTVSTVDPRPMIVVTSPSPIGGVIYTSSANPVFSGVANVSAGYFDATGVNVKSIVSVGFKVGTGPWQTVPATGAPAPWSVVVTGIPVGVLTPVTFNATDSAGNVGVAGPFQVLIDQQPPSISFVTANSSTIQAGGAVQATIVDTLGDLNFTSVSATRNGTAVPSSSISISGTNNPGANTTYSVSISGLPTGKWVIKVSACDLAGNCATSKALMVTVTVPLDQSFTLVGTPGKVTVAGQVAINATFTNNLPFTQSGIVMLVVRNLQGQAIYIATATVSPAAGATFSALLVVSPVPPGTYNAELFAITSTGVVIAKSTTFSITLP